MEQIDLLKRVIENEQFPVQSGTIIQFLAYQKLLLEWNSRINLISHSDEKRIITRHFLQSIGLLKIVTFPMNSTVMDLGSGAGFPGIPIKLIRPDIVMVLSESIKKKANFLQNIIRELRLEKIRVVAERINETNPLKNPVDFIVVRAVINLTELVRWSFPSLKPDGSLIVVKGVKAKEELSILQKYFGKFQITKCEIIPYDPFSNVFSLRESYVVILKK